MLPTASDEAQEKENSFVMKDHLPFPYQSIIYQDLTIPLPTISRTFHSTRYIESIKNVLNYITVVFYFMFN